MTIKINGNDCVMRKWIESQYVLDKIIGKLVHNKIYSNKTIFTYVFIWQFYEHNLSLSFFFLPKNSS